MRVFSFRCQTDQTDLDMSSLAVDESIKGKELNSLSPAAAIPEI